MYGKAWTERVRDLLERISEVDAITSGRSSHDFLQDKILIAAVERHIEIIGEITSHIPDNVKAEFATIPWDEIRGMRNILAHGYDIVIPDLLWHTATVSLETLEEAALKILEKYAKT